MRFCVFLSCVISWLLSSANFRHYEFIKQFDLDNYDLSENSNESKNNTVILTMIGRRRLSIILGVMVSFLTFNAVGSGSLSHVLEIGKSWEWQTKHWSGEDLFSVRYTVVGDTVVGGEEAFVIRCVASNSQRETYSVYSENNGVVYAWNEDSFEPLIDFNVNEGSNVGYGWEVIDIVDRNINGTVRRCILLECGSLKDIWVEGIGDLNGNCLLSDIILPPAHTISLNNCEKDGVKLYDRQDYDFIWTSLCGVEKDGEINSTPICFDLQGKRIKTPVKGNLYIVRTGSNGFVKEIVNH